MGGILFPCLGVVYLYTCSRRTTHSVPDYIVPEPQLITEPYECRPDGSLVFCVRDNCRMRWKPPGTHHCSTCGVCRIGFDHHCPWVRESLQSESLLCHSLTHLSTQLGNCVTTGRLKAFLVLLVLTSITIPLASLPLLPVLRTHVIAALAASHADAWATDIWWNRPYSWILCGGPPGRWIVGTLLGFRLLRKQRPPEPSWLSGHLVSQPHIRLAVLVAAATPVWLFAVVRILSNIHAQRRLHRCLSVAGHDSRRCLRCDQRPEYAGQRPGPHPRAATGSVGPDYRRPVRLHPVFGDTGVVRKHDRCQ